MKLKTFIAKSNFNLVSIAIFVLMFAAVLIGFVFYTEYEKEYPVTFILCMAGCIIAGLLGIMRKRLGNFFKQVIYYFPFGVVAISYLTLSSLKGEYVHHVNHDMDNIVETAKQYVLIMGSLAGFSLLIMGFLMFEISSSKLKQIDIRLHAFKFKGTDLEHADELRAEIEAENVDRKDTVTVFLNCLIITLFGSIVAAIGANEEPGNCQRALSVFLPSSAFMALSVIFLHVGLARMIDTFQIVKAKRFFSNLVLTLLLFGLIEFSGSVDDATTIGDTDILWNPQVIAVITAVLIGIISYAINRGRQFKHKHFPLFAFTCIVVATTLYLYSELFVKETFTEDQSTIAEVGYLMLVAFSALIGYAFPFLKFDPQSYE